jgi:tRNA(fMet)-specific endonuclease VapC
MQPYGRIRHGGRAACRGEIRAELAGMSTPIRGYGVLLAGHARAVNWTMVTHNVREFERMRGLRVEDWT